MSMRNLNPHQMVIDVHPHLSANLLINVPGDLKPGEKRPAILCWHGHGPFGKDAVMGDRRSPAFFARHLRSKKGLP